MTSRLLQPVRVAAVLTAIACVIGGTVQAAVAAPANDDFADATTFDVTDAGPLTGSNVGATDEVDEPFQYSKRSVWWQFVAPIHGEVTLSSAGSSFDAHMAVYVGDTLETLEVVHTQTAAATPNPFDVDAGDTYSIRVAGFNDDTGDIVLGVTWEEGDPRGVIALESLAGTDVDMLDFGSLAAGDSATRTVRVRNVGNAPLTVDDVTLATRSFADGEYRIVGDTASGSPLPAGASREVVIEFAPQTAPAGSPDVVYDAQSLVGLDQPSEEYSYIGSQVIAIRVHTYVHNTGGRGAADYTATMAYPDRDGVADAESGSETMAGGDAYSVVTGLTIQGTTAYEGELLVELPQAFAFTHILQAVPQAYNVSSIYGVFLERLPDAMLVVESDDVDALAASPPGTYVQLFGETTSGAGGSPGATDRWSGATRYATAAAVSASAFPQGADIAFVATGANFPDALAGGPAGGVLDGPILLTTRDAVPAETLAELARLGPSQVVVLGGASAVADTVVQELAGVAPVARWSGVNRYATAAAVSASAFPQGADVAFVATGANFPDALAGGPAGGVLDGPILLTTRDAVPAETLAELARLGPSQVVVLGGTSAVSDAVAQQLADIVG